MPQRYKQKYLFSLLCFLWLGFSIMLGSLEGYAYASNKVQWSSVKSGTYSPLYTGVIATNYEMAYGGLQLASMKIVKEADKADVVMSASQIGARSIVELKQQFPRRVIAPRN
jgi:hypothetical protein